MDIVTHALLGAITAQAINKQPRQLVPIVAGALAALMPDIDVFIRSASDELLTLSYHRHFTHSLFFAPFGALLATMLLAPLLRKRIELKKIYIFSFVGYTSACLLDACTSYGTYLFWPIYSRPVSMNIIAVVDLAFSFTLITALILAYYYSNRKWAIAGLLVCGGYLCLGLLQYQRALNLAEQHAHLRDIIPQRIIIKPTMSNLILWRAIIIDDNNLAYVNAVRPGIFNDDRFYSGKTIVLIDRTKWQNLPANSRAWQDLQRYYLLADKLLVEHPEHPHFIGDARYAMLPTSVKPIWGISLNPQDPHLKASITVDRTLTDTERKEFLNMLLGK